MALTVLSPPEVRTLQWQPFTSSSDAGVHVHRVPNHGEVAIHDHVFHEIVYVESGTAEHLTAEASRRLRPGDLIVIRPHVWHGYRRARNLSIVNCLFDKRLVERFAPLLARVDGTFDLFRRPCRRTDREAPALLHLRPAQRPALAERLDRIIAEQRERSNGWQAAAAAAMLDILIMTARLSRRPLPDDRVGPTDPTRQAVLDAVTHLEAHYAEPVTLDALAERVNLSPAYLSRNFSRSIGMGIVEFIHHLRCEEACRLLRWTDQPIGRIAARVGYNEIAYFSRCFRRQTGQSPRDYRRTPVAGAPA